MCNLQPVMLCYPILYFSTIIEYIFSCKVIREETIFLVPLKHKDLLPATKTDICFYCLCECITHYSLKQNKWGKFSGWEQVPMAKSCPLKAGLPRKQFVDHDLLVA